MLPHSLDSITAVLACDCVRHVWQGLAIQGVLSAAYIVSFQSSPYNDSGPYHLHLCQGNA